MDTMPETGLLTLEQIEEMQAPFERWRHEAAAAMYRIDAHERPYRAGCGEMYRLWNTRGQAVEVLEAFRREQYPNCST
jgi:hypothetical protein